MSSNSTLGHTSSYVSWLFWIRIYEQMVAHKHEQYLPQRLLGTGQRRPSWKLRHKGWKKHWAPGTYHAPNITQSTNRKHVWNIGTYDNHFVNFRHTDLPVLHRRLSRLPHGSPKLTHRAKWCVLRIRCYMGRQKAIRRYLTLSDGRALVNELFWGTARVQSDAIRRYPTHIIFR